jgi:hypothetical protein
VQDAAEWQRLVVESAGLVLEPERVARWRDEAETRGRRARVSIRWEALPASNAYANPGARWIEAAPIVSEESYADFKHEQGHMEHPCRPTHTRATISEDRTCCVRCEIAAWKFAQQDAIDWTKRMHDELRRSIDAL